MKISQRVIRSLCLFGLWLGLGLQAHAQTDTVTYVYTDPQGTPLVEADASGNVIARYDYTPYGNAVASLGSPPNGPGYTGHVNDPETGLVYMQARYYQPDGRFLSPDPVGPSAGNIFSFNRYAYANNNPVMNVDPTGKTCGSTSDVSAGVQRMRNASDGCGAASSTIVRAYNDSGKAYYVYADGGVVVQSGNRPSRDNNPGNLRKGSNSAVSTTRAVGWDFTPTSNNDKVTSKLPFAMFSSKEAGVKALEATLRKAHGGQTILDAIKGYAPATDNNSPIAYGAFVTKSTGLSSSRLINSLDAGEVEG